MTPRRAALLLCFGVVGAARAQDLPEAPAARTPEPNVRQTVVEGDHVRVEELRVRGEVRRIVVRTQGSQPGSTYEIAPASGGRDMTPGPLSSRGVAGRSLWTVLSF